MPMRRLYRNIRLHNKLLISYLFVILFTAASIGAISYRISNDELIGNTEQFAQALVEQLAVNVPNRAAPFEQSTYAVQNDREFIAMLSSRIDSPAEPNLYINQLYIRTYFGNFLGLSQDIRAMVVQSVGGELYWTEESEYYGRSGGMNREQAQARMDWILERLGWRKDIQSAWLPSDRPNEIIFTRILINPSTLETVGRIAFFLDSRFLQLLPETTGSFTGNVVILNRFRDMLYGEPSAAPIVAAFEERQGAASPMTPLEVDNTNYLVFSSQSANQAWSVMLIVQTSELFRASAELGLTILITGAAALAVTAMIAFGISRQVTGNIRILERTMRRVEEGDFSIQVKPSSRDEIGLLGVRFNMMVIRINDLIQRLYVEQMAKQKAEFQVLKAQIHPHFLYNTLGSIHWLARMNNQETIARMIKNLIELLRISVKRSSEFTTVEEEFSYLENYLSIQKFRYEDRFQVRYELDDRVKDRQMLSFILQPLVENALLHGIEVSKGNGLIVIRACASGDHLLLEVEDNGVGMEPEQVDKLLDDNAERTYYPGLHSIGIHNVHARIRLYHGDGYGLSYRTAPGRGTTAIVTLPLHHDESGRSETECTTR